MAEDRIHQVTLLDLDCHMNTHCGDGGQGFAGMLTSAPFSFEQGYILCVYAWVPQLASDPLDIRTNAGAAL